jgi:cystathionine beta-lyase
VLFTLYFIYLYSFWKTFDMQYNFDEIIDRSGTDALKYEARKRIFGTNDVLPMWVADMDLRTPDFIVDAMKKRMEHEIYGYTLKPDSLYEATIGWMQRRHGWKIEKDWIVFTPGVVPAFTMCILAYSNPGDKVIVQSPVYYPFFWAVDLNKRIKLNNRLKRVGDKYEMDLEDLKKNIDPSTKMMLFCSPHNPVGRVWTKEELLEVADICLKNNLVMISDEIHSDLIFKGYKHTPYAMLGQEMAMNSVTCVAPSKTFNVAGLSTSALIIPNPELRKKIEHVIDSLHIAGGNIFGSVAMEAAYAHGDEWLRQALEYLEGNVQYLEEFVKENLPKVKVIHPEGTYMAWLDLSGLGLTDDEMRKFMIEKVKVGMNHGPIFGPGGEGFQRINLGCPRAIVKEAMTRMKNAM